MCACMYGVRSICKSMYVYMSISTPYRVVVFSLFFFVFLCFFCIHTLSTTNDKSRPRHTIVGKCSAAYRNMPLLNAIRNKFPESEPISLQPHRIKIMHDDIGQTTGIMTYQYYFQTTMLEQLFGRSNYGRCTDKLMQAWPEYVCIFMHPIIRTSGPFLQPRQVIPTHTHTTTEHQYFNSDSGGRFTALDWPPCGGGQKLSRKIPCGLFRHSPDTTYSGCRSSFRLSSGPWNAGCFALFRFFFPWVLRIFMETLMLVQHGIFSYYSILNKLFFMHGLYSLDLGSMLKSHFICTPYLYGYPSRAGEGGHLRSLMFLASDAPYILGTRASVNYLRGASKYHTPYSLFISSNILVLSLYSQYQQCTPYSPEYHKKRGKSLA